MASRVDVPEAGIPDEEYTLVLCSEGKPPPIEGRALNVVPWGVKSADRTLRGRDSRDPPNIEDGAKARTEAFVSSEFRLRLFEDDARVNIEALSVSKLLAVAVVYVAGLPPCWIICDGKAEAGVDAAGN